MNLHNFPPLGSNRAPAAEKTARKIERDRAGNVEELAAMLRLEDGVGETSSVAG